MLTDTKLRSLKPAEKAYKLPDRDGLYVIVLTTGTVSFRYNYRINNRQETLVIGKYGPGGLTLAEARERLAEAKKTFAAGRSPSRQKAREKRKLTKWIPLGNGPNSGSRTIPWRNRRAICVDQFSRAT